MPTKIQKWGNSLGVRLPQEIARRFKLRVGSSVVLISQAKGISIKPIVRAKPSLKELVGRVTSRNRHAEQDWGSSVGKEIW